MRVIEDKGRVAMVGGIVVESVALRHTSARSSYRDVVGRFCQRFLPDLRLSLVSIDDVVGGAYSGGYR